MGFPSVSKFLVDQPNTKQVLFFGSVVLYPILFYVLHSKIGNAVIFLSAFPVFIAAYAYGIKYGLIASLLALPINYLFVSMSGVDGLEELKMTRFIGLHILILVGSLMLGYSCLMQRRLKTEVKRRKEVEKRLKHLAHYDQLTEVANRHYGDELMQQMLQKAKLENTRFIIIFIDLNDFKKLNDQYGHHIGDLALQVVANQLKTCVGDEGVIVRNGGDEFLVLLEPNDSFELVEEVVGTIQRVFSRPVFLEDYIVHLSLSYGMASYPDDADNLEELIRKADNQMYIFKEQKKPRVEL
ncbi:GGDEF domain-containing protein [Thiomicrorhabdus lithotrophica]|uniref:Diguanylate cyclase n=1 Tax=Thiomicrorhabdus lithotrophica TaxID=2949997 RepID=A0ABY8CAC4_9GAMM|nr:diguanylate cyclase [Thiomicrorhabdus lithotrophica]WEJ62935.1 diguanylate cyclase [Thiomicrorhabdus lithotrophica]